MAYIGQSLTEGTRRAYNYTATASQTTFNAVYTVGAVDVYQNGVLLTPDDYTASTGTTIVLDTAAALDDEITIICHNTFSVADTVSSSQGGTFNNDITVSGDLTVDTNTLYVDSTNNRVGVGTTSPQLPLDVVGQIRATDGSCQVRMIPIDASNAAVVGTYSNDALVLNTNSTERLRINSSGLVGINKSAPSTKLHVFYDGNQDDNQGIIQAETNGTGGASFIARSPYGTTQLFAWANHGIRIGSRSVANGGLGHLHFTTGNDTVSAVLDSSSTFTVGSGLGVGGGTGNAAVRIYGTSGGDIVQFFQNRNNSTPYWYFNTSGGYGVYSDKRLKENVTDLPQEAAVNLIRNIKPVEFTWKEEFGKPDTPVTGFLAQDVLSNATTVGQKNILTNWETYDEADPDSPHMGLSDHRMLPSMVGTIQYLLAKVEALEARIETLETPQGA